MSKEIQITYELAGTALGVVSDAKFADAKANTAEFLKTIGVEGMDASVAENSASEVHLCLPYYSWVDEAASAIEDQELQASGGRTELARLPATTDYGEATARNAHQCAFNARMALTLQYSRIDNSYDGDFDVDRNPTHLTNPGPQANGK